MEIPDAVLLAVMIGTVGVVGGEAQSRKKVCGFPAAGFRVLRKGVQGHRLLLALCPGSLVDAEIRQLAVGKLHAFQGVLAQGRIYRLIRKAGGDIGLGVPEAVLFRPGQIIFVQGEGRAAAHVDGGCAGICRRHAAGNRKDHDRSHGKGAEPYHKISFHGESSVSDF